VLYIEKTMIESIPVSDLDFSGNEKKYLAECIDTGWISSEGPFIEKFEKDFCRYVGRAHGIAVSSGSAALDIAVIAAGITTGDEVIMPTFTIISPALSIIKAGAIPVLVDSEPCTYNMDVSAIESKITSKTKAIIIVHIYGLPARIDEILSLAKKYNLKVIEDAAEMHGQTYKGKKCGSFGDISIFSFYANKLITTGEGGMILCDDQTVARHCMKLRNLAFLTNGPRFVHDELGFNYRMTNMQGALGVAQLEKIDASVRKKREIGRYYNKHLSYLEQYGFKLPLPSTGYAENIYWAFTLIARDEAQKKECVELLGKNKIGTRPFFACMHLQPVFRKMNLFLTDKHPHAERMATNGFYIPTGLGLTNEALERVVSVFHTIFKPVKAILVCCLVFDSVVPI
jgi:perosamine synthetase